MFHLLVLLHLLDMLVLFEMLFLLEVLIYLSCLSYLRCLPCFTWDACLHLLEVLHLLVLLVLLSYSTYLRCLTNTSDACVSLKCLTYRLRWLSYLRCLSYLRYFYLPDLFCVLQGLLSLFFFRALKIFNFIALLTRNATLREGYLKRRRNTGLLLLINILRFFVGVCNTSYMCRHYKDTPGSSQVFLGFSLLCLGIFMV